MTRWTLSLLQPLTHDVDASPISLESFATRSVADIERVQLTGMGPTVRIGDLFRVGRHSTSNDSIDCIEINGDVERFHHLGARHGGGRFAIDGSAGNWVGLGMRDGELIVTGNVGDGAGAMMRGGRIRIDANARNGVGGPCSSSHTGMSGGLITVGGNVGDYASHRMRRGAVVINGNAGVALASQMIAGTVCVSGTFLAQAAYAMRRGTLVLQTHVDFCPLRFSRPSVLESPMVALLRAHLTPEITGLRAACRLLERVASGGLKSRRGDFSVGGQGEILAICPDSN